MSGENGRDRFEAKSGVDGSFAMAAVRAAEYTLQVVDDELVPAGDAPKVMVAEEAASTGNEVRVTPGAVVTGRVYDKRTGRGFSAELAASRREGTGQSRSEIRTGAEGTYVIRGLAKGAYEVSLREVDGYTNNDIYEKRQSLSVEPGRQYDGIDFELDRGLVIVGRVVDGTGRGVSKARVNGRTRTGNTYSDAESGANGSFELTGFQVAQEVLITATKEGLAAKPVELVKVEDQDVRGVEVVMIGEGTIAGTIVDSTGRVLVGAGVHARGDANYVRSRSAESSAGGEFKLAGLSGGKWELYASPSEMGSWGGGAPLEVVELEDGENKTGVRLVLETSGKETTRGTVRNTRGEPVAGADLQGWSSQGGSIQARTSSDGSFVIRDVPAGSFQVDVRHGDYTSVQVDITAGDESAEIVLQDRGAIEGRVLHGRTRQPIADFRLAVLAYDMQTVQMNPSMVRNGSGRHDAQGYFIEESVEAKENILVAEASGYAKAYVPVQVMPGQTTRGVEVLLLPEAFVEGVVVSPSGNGVFGARVFDGPPPNEWQRDQVALTTTDREGRFQLEGLSPETTMISAWHPDYAAGSANVVLGSSQVTEVVIRLTTGAAIEGVVRVGGVGKAEAYVGVTSASNQQDQRGVQTESTGGYELAGLTPGSGTAYASYQTASGQHRNMQKTVELQDGLVTRVDFDFASANGVVEGYLTYGGAPVTQGGVQAQSGNPETGQETFYSQVDGDGYYRMEGLIAGEVTLQAHGVMDRRDLSRRTRVEVAEGAVMRVDIDFGGGGTR